MVHATLVSPRCFSQLSRLHMIFAYAPIQIRRSNSLLLLIGALPRKKHHLTITAGYELQFGYHISSVTTNGTLQYQWEREHRERDRYTPGETVPECMTVI